MVNYFGRNNKYDFLRAGTIWIRPVVSCATFFEKSYCRGLLSGAALVARGGSVDSAVYPPLHANAVRNVALRLKHITKDHQFALMAATMEGKEGRVIKALAIDAVLKIETALCWNPCVFKSSPPPQPSSPSRSARYTTSHAHIHQPAHK